MTRNKLKEVLRYVRFDLKSTRAQRLQIDNFALTSQGGNPFIENCILYYKAGETITIDEQLFPTKSRCPFTQYMSTKPDKHWCKVLVRSRFKVKMSRE